jgi:urea transport system substrate-binding protein
LVNFGKSSLNPVKDPMSDDERLISFGPYVLHPAARSLTVNGYPVVIGGRALDLLIALVDRRGEVVAKKTLLEIVWPGVTVEEENLKVHIMAVRRALKDNGKAYVVTVPRRGYSFVAPVSTSGLSTVTAQSAGTAREQVQALRAVAASNLPYRIGILHSLSGPLAISEGAIVDATLLAVRQINASGGIRGREIEPTVVDCQSDEATFAREAERLITKGNVRALFGGFTSACRKEMLPIVEHHDHLLLFPMQYEGLEQSPNIFYLGAAPNQQIIPAVRWGFAFLQRKRFFLIGWDSIYPRATNAIVRDEVHSLGGEIVGEEYVHMGKDGMERPLHKLAQIKPDIIVNSLTRDLNALYSRRLRELGVTSEESPTIYLSISENEIQSLAPRDIIGDYAAWNYFQSLEHPTNQVFVKLFQTHYGIRRVTADPMEAAYSGVHLWAQAAGAANSDDVAAIRRLLPNQHFSAPGGAVQIDAENQHTWKIMRLARIVDRGQFSIVWSSEKPIRPEPYPKSRSVAEWHEFLRGLHNGWGGRWTRADFD